MDRQIVLKRDILDALSAVGMRAGQTVMVHCSLSSLGYVCGGAQPVIEALLQTVGETGTIMMPTQSWKNLDPESGVHWQEPQEWWQLIRDNWPAYDERITPTNTMGAVAEMFRTWPGTHRSDHPARSVAANGRHAQFLTENHDLSNIFGDGSPIARLYDLDGYVLLVGVGYDKNTCCIWQMPVRSTPASTTVWNTARSWKTVSACGRSTEHFLSTARTSTRSALLLNVNARCVRRLSVTG